MTMWGEVAEPMEDLATAHCYCEYTKLESLETVTWSDRNDAEIACANEGIINKKDAFIRWALPLHRQRLGDELHCTSSRGDGVFGVPKPPSNGFSNDRWALITALTP